MSTTSPTWRRTGGCMTRGRVRRARAAACATGQVTGTRSKRSQAPGDFAPAPRRSLGTPWRSGVARSSRGVPGSAARYARSWLRAPHESLCPRGREGDAVLNDGGELVRLVADPRVARDSDPAAQADDAQPLFVRAVGWEVRRVSLDRQAVGRECRRKRVSEIPISEEDEAQAARSYRTASSISSGARS
jgi:hypothetical protein